MGSNVEGLPGPLLPARAVDAHAVEAEVLAEALRGELLVARMRAVVFTLMFLSGLAATVLGIGPQWLPGGARLVFVAIAGPFTALAWAWLVYLPRLKYRPTFGYVTTAMDVLVFCLINGLGVVLGPVELARVTALGSVPTILILFFVLATAAVRQSVGACLLAGLGGVLGFGVVVGLAEARLGADGELGAFSFFAGPQVWLGRTGLFVFTAALLGLAARNARRMAARSGLATAERQALVQVFGRYVDPEVAREAIGRDGSGAEVRQVTVLFTDLRDFTAMSEKLGPAEVLELLNRHYSAIVPVVHRHGGTVNKFIGDAIMATFGAPLRQADHAERAVRAALEMAAETVTLNQALRAEGKPELRMGVGVATGPVVVGSLGAAERVEYAVIGDTVNTASRLEGLNKELKTQLLMSAATRAALGPAFEVRELGAVPVKGKAEPVPVFTVERVAQAA